MLQETLDKYNRLPCDACGGTGEIKKKQEICYKCNGFGKYDWVAEILRKYPYEKYKNFRKTGYIIKKKLRKIIKEHNYEYIDIIDSFIKNHYSSLGIDGYALIDEETTCINVFLFTRGSKEVLAMVFDVNKEDKNL